MSPATKLFERLRMAAKERQAAERTYGRAVRSLNRQPNVLTKAQAAELASRLHVIIERRVSVLRNKKGALVAGAIDSRSGVKELYRLTLPPGTDPERRGLRLILSRYFAIVDQLATMTAEPVDRLRRELLAGTSLDPLLGADETWTEVDTVAMILQDLVSRLDRQHDWTALFSKTADLRIQLGARESWPLIPADWCFDILDKGDTAHFERHAEAAADRSQVFHRQNPSHPWGGRPQAEQYFNGEQLQDDEFFYVPHAPIGHVQLWDLPQRISDPVGYERGRLLWVANARRHPEQFCVPRDDWDEVSQAPRGQASRDEHSFSDFLWLVAYPHLLDSSRVVPALYQRGQEGGAWLMPLERDTLGGIADGLWSDGKRDSTLLDRLIEILQPDAGGTISQVEMALNRTGTWLQRNPVLQRERAARQRLLDAIRINNRPASDNS